MSKTIVIFAVLLIGIASPALASAVEPLHVPGQAFRLAMAAEGLDAEWSPLAVERLAEVLSNSGLEPSLIECSASLCWYQLELSDDKRAAHSNAVDLYLQDAVWFGETLLASTTTESGTTVVDMFVSRRDRPLPRLSEWLPLVPTAPESVAPSAPEVDAVEP